MNCAETQHLLHAYIDAELDVANSLEIEHHLQRCQRCQQDYDNYQRLRTTIKGDALYFQTPASLHKYVYSSLGRVRSADDSPRALARRWLGAAALLVLAFLSIWGIARFWFTPPSLGFMAQQVLDSHIRSLMGNHLADVTSSDQHIIKPWFVSRLDFSPPVIDLTSQGYTLVGGRLDYLAGQPVAVIVYKCGNHVINLFIWPSSQKDEAGAAPTTLQGYNLMYWRAYGMNCWAVSDLALNELQQFAQLMNQHTDRAVAVRFFPRGP